MLKIAHYRVCDQTPQSVSDHLTETAELCTCFTAKIGLPVSGELLGLLHDLGKYSDAFQKFIYAATGLQGEQAQKEAENMPSHERDHATAGAQYLWRNISQATPASTRYHIQALCAALISHHSRSGILDFIDLQGASPFLTRIQKPDHQSHLSESLSKADAKIISQIAEAIAKLDLHSEAKQRISAIHKDSGTELFPFHMALYSRFLFSCLLDADRINTIDFEDPSKGEMRNITSPPDWSALLERFENRIKKFSAHSTINEIRATISEECRNAAEHKERILTLPVPTGGGKTLASLRFALHRAVSGHTNPVDRIIYILPYTTIIEQNADEVREILGESAVLEHHSNLSDDKDTKANRVLSENWDAPVVFTTMVQFLDALYSSGTKAARRMHQMGNAILIFDEIQCLPIKTVHLFNNALNFLTSQANTTAVLCTATMPLLERVSQKHGHLRIHENSCIITDKQSLSQNLRRTQIIDRICPEKWSYDDIVELAIDQQKDHQSVLIVCNTKDSARSLFDRIKSATVHPVVHLSTNMCPAHRQRKIKLIRETIDPKNPKPLICVSTQLIEAGVDLDFGCVIRSLAGLDSIIQAAGRCNRHGHHKELKPVFVLNFAEESIPDALAEIKVGQEITTRVFREYHSDPERFDNSLLSEAAMTLFYEYYFYDRAKLMTYEIKARPKSDHQKTEVSHDTNLIDLLCTNGIAYKECSERGKDKSPLTLPLQQAHSTAAEAFRVIDAPTQGILVPYQSDTQDGSALISKLAACYSNENIPLPAKIQLHKQAQKFTVNAFPHIIKKLSESRAISEIHPGSGIYELAPAHYSEDYGITLEPLSEANYICN
jgi:CRISPR-associated endonuclease/helicase Cas3